MPKTTTLRERIESNPDAAKALVEVAIDAIGSLLTLSAILENLSDPEPLAPTHTIADAAGAAKRWAADAMRMLEACAVPTR